ncbi:MAG TPA: enoyl-CoA hydratase/isomerase family protein [Polyangiales bacterium]|jgi:enoyl-CoA hydratase/carnithine racemase|nr:enoyl-CoA hydratase/isomerase family protein [Polyangiales bacterium]
MIDLQVDDQVHILRMNQGENRFNRASLDAWNAALDAIEQSELPTALVTCGEGKFYSNGLDLDWMVAAGQDEAIENVQRVHELLVRVLTLPVITIAAISGHAFAAGAMFALAHDFRLMRSDRGFFCLPEVDVQLPFSETMQTLIVNRLPIQTAHEAMVTGRRYGGPQALERGIVDAVESESEVVPKAIALAKSFIGKPRATLGAIKRAKYATVIAACERARAERNRAPSKV